MYCGWQTRGARIRWGAVVFLLVAFAALGIMYGVTSRDCVVCKSEANFVDRATGENVASVHVCHDLDGVGELTGAHVPGCTKTGAEIRDRIAVHNQHDTREVARPPPRLQKNHSFNAAHGVVEVRLHVCSQMAMSRF